MRHEFKCGERVNMVVDTDAQQGREVSFSEPVDDGARRMYIKAALMPACRDKEKTQGLQNRIDSIQAELDKVAVRLGLAPYHPHDIRMAVHMALYTLQERSDDAEQHEAATRALLGAREAELRETLGGRLKELEAEVERLKAAAGEEPVS